VKTTDELWPILEELGEDAVRRRVADGLYGPEKLPSVWAWQRMKEAQRAEQVEREQRTIDQEANRISAEANRLAKRANVIAVVAVIVAVVAVLVALFHR
jgi:hypothetical protein